MDTWVYIALGVAFFIVLLMLTSSSKSVTFDIFTIGQQYTQPTEAQVDLTALPVTSTSPLRSYRPNMVNVMPFRLVNSLGAGNTLIVSPMFVVNGQTVADPTFLSVAGSSNTDGSVHRTYLNSTDPSFSPFSRVGFQDQLYVVSIVYGETTFNKTLRIPRNTISGHQVIGVAASLENGHPVLQIQLRDDRINMTRTDLRQLLTIN